VRGHHAPQETVRGSTVRASHRRSPAYTIGTTIGDFERVENEIAHRYSKESLRLRRHGVMAGASCGVTVRQERTQLERRAAQP
jgi:hypothetical protein